MTMDSPNKDTSNFRKLLAEEISWPHVYMFKFIVPANLDKEAQIIELFPADSEVSFRSSRTGKYTSITIKSLMNTPDEVLDLYKKAAEIEGVTSL